jgi:hypothetical protein
VDNSIEGLWISEALYAGITDAMARLARTTSGDALWFKTLYHGHHLLVRMIADEQRCIGNAEMIANSIAIRRGCQIALGARRMV